MTTSATPAPRPAPAAPPATAPYVASFRDPQFLLAHVEDTLRFYAPHAFDPTGGFYHFFRDDGSVYDRTTRHLVSSCRFVFNHAMAYRHFGDARDLAYARHGLRFLRDAHWDAEHEGYDWEIEWRDGAKRATRDGTRHCYGLAFVLLAAAHAAMAGVEEAKPLIAHTFDLMEHRFWDRAAGLYADDATPNWTVSSYRGQNANMHATEALLAAYEATGHLTYLDRAEKIATNIVQRQAALSQGLVWEHFHADWSVDWEYNKEDSSNIFRPWGFQPGHQTEWAKLLLILERHRPLDWLVPRAIELFDAAFAHAWDSDHGGLCYGFGPDYTVCDHDKYFWVQAESFAAAALLADAQTEVALVVFGELNDDAGAFGADTLVVLRDFDRRAFAPERELDALRACAAALSPQHVFIPDNATGDGDLGRRYAAAANASVATQVVEIAADHVGVYVDAKRGFATRTRPEGVLLAP